MDEKILNIKNELIDWLSTLDDHNMIELLNKIKDLNETDWADSLTADEYRSIQKGLSELKDGKTFSHSVVFDKYEKYIRD